MMRSRVDLFLVVPALFLAGTGVFVLYGLSAGEGAIWSWDSLFLRQTIFCVVSILAFVFFSRINYSLYRRAASTLYFGTLLLLVAVFFVGSAVRGTAGWIDFGPAQFQPVEIAKVSLILFLSGFIAHKKIRLGEASRIVASGILTTILIVLVLLQPDFGSAMVLVAIWIGMTLLSGVRGRNIAAMVLAGVIVAAVSWSFLGEYQRDRIFSVLNPHADERGSGYNTIQSLVAVGSGGLFGKGMGYASQSQLNFLPEKHTDFIFSSLTESFGFVGALAVIAAIVSLLFRIYSIGKYAPDSFGYLLCGGVLSLFAVQTIENIGMNVGLLPITGIPLPLVSYGGSSLLSLAIVLGIVHNVSVRTRWRHSISAPYDA